MADRVSGHGPGSVPTPAATVVPLRDGAAGLEVLLLRRSGWGAFGGMWVFPGGQVDAADQGAGAELDVARRAAVRETREEAGIELDEARLVTLAFWVPPPDVPHRFATWFFLAPMPSDHAPVVVDRVEIHEYRWQAPAAGMAAHNAGEIELAPPTFATLWWLSHHGDVAAALAAGAARVPERFMTRIVRDAAGLPRATVWDGDAGYLDGDLDRPGPRRRMWVDSTGWRMESSP